MKNNEIEITTVLRRPKYPVIVLSENELLSANNIKELAYNFLALRKNLDKEYIKIIDSSGEEFWYDFDMKILAPGFLTKMWTKKQIITLFNNSLTAKKVDCYYSEKSLSNKRFSKIIGDICNLIQTITRRS